MPIYDPCEQRMTVRVVYDGLACAGKTTNLRQLSMLFAAQRSSNLYSPADLEGRTLYFDWMSITAGVVCGFPLLCQVVSVPGQVVLTPRRRHLLGTADVVVYVCESNESALDAARAGLALYDDVARERGAPVPLVIQANKQDRPGAMTGTALLRALGREGVPVLEAIASEGVGVVDTFVGAVRTVARSMQARTETGTLRVEVRRAPTASDVLGRLAEEAIDPEWAAEMLLEEAQAAFLVGEAVTEVAQDVHLRAAREAAAADLTRIDVPDASRMPAQQEQQEQQAPQDKQVQQLQQEAGAPLPSPDVPTGFIWPAHTGRATIRSLALSSTPAPSVHEDGTVVVSALGHVARTSTRAHFADGEGARQALVRTARECTQLGGLLVPETVLVAQPAADGTCWIWTVRPDLQSVEQLLGSGNASPDLLAAFGAAVVEALRTSFRHGLSLDFSPSVFGVQHGRLRYLGEITPEPPTVEALSSSVVGALDTLQRAGADMSAFLDAFERELQRQLTVEERARATLTIPRRLYTASTRTTEAP